MSYIDIHSHLIYGVDDGAKDLETSIAYIKQLKEKGLTKVICTPHVEEYNPNYINKVTNNFKVLRKIADEEGIDVYLGSEILLSSNTSNLLLKNRVPTLNNTKYILVELNRYDNYDFSLILSMLDDLVDKGYFVILAHPEVYYNYRKINYMVKLREHGVYLQLDASSILKKTDRKTRKFAKSLLKKHLVDFVASDSHCNKVRPFTDLMDAYEIISKKYGKNYSDIIFYNNQKTIVGDVIDEK